MNKVVMLTSLILLARSSLADGQQSTLFYDHKPGISSLDSRTSYRHADDKIADRRAGMPVRLSAPLGAKACIVVENANPVLYTYSIGSRVEEVSVPQEYETLLAAVQFALAGAMNRHLNAAPATTTKYALEVAQLYKQVNLLQSRRAASDKIAAFDKAVDTVRAAFEYARGYNTNAEATYAALKKVLSSASTASDTLEWLTVEMLHTQQVALFNKAKAVDDEFTNGRNALQEAMCVPVNMNRQKVFLSVRAKSSSDSLSLSRPRGDTVVSFEIDPISDVAFEVVAGAVLSFATDDKVSFRLADGVITQESNEDPRVRPSLIALGRAWTPSWIWGGFGISGDTEGITDVFIGPVGRFGFQGNGPQLNIGAGAVLSWIPTGLKSGASVGSPLPNDAKDVDDVIDRNMRPALGIVFTITGLSFKDQK